MAAWTCHDDLRDNRQFAYYLRKAGLKGRWVLTQETIEDKVTDLKAQLGGGAHQKLVNTLSKQVGEFEFEDARETLAKLRNALETA